MTLSKIIDWFNAEKFVVIDKKSKYFKMGLKKAGLSDLKKKQIYLYHPTDKYLCIHFQVDQVWPLEQQ